MSMKETKTKIERAVQNKIGLGNRINIIGQSGSGKGSSCKRHLGFPDPHIGVEEGSKTQLVELAEYRAKVFVDNPGHGTAQFPTDRYYETQSIAQSLFVIFCCDSQIKESDLKIITKIDADGIPYLINRTKSDNFYEDGKTDEELRAKFCKEVNRNLGYQINDRIIFTSSRFNYGGTDLHAKLKSLLSLAHESHKNRWNECLTSEVEQHINELKFSSYTRLCAVTALITATDVVDPTPLSAVVAHPSAMNQFFSDTRQAFDLETESSTPYFFPTKHIQYVVTGTLQEIDLNDFGVAISETGDDILKIGTDVLGEEAMKAIKDKVLEEATKRFGRDFVSNAMKETGKFIPIAGKVVGGVITAFTTWMNGATFIEECAALAEKSLLNSLQK